MRVLITGGRNYDDQDLLDKTLDALHAANGVTTLIHGDASGADRLAKKWAQSRGVLVETHPAEWKKYGRAAGPIRNQKMLADRPDQLVAFPGGKGTADMIARAKKAGLKVLLVGE